MQANYGNKFINLWCTKQLLPDGRDAGVVNAMDTWAIKLAPYKDKPEALKKVLDNLPLDPPSLPQFMGLLKNCYVHKENLQIDNQLTEEQKAKNRERTKEILKTICKKV